MSLNAIYQMNYLIAKLVSNKTQLAAKSMPAIVDAIKEEEERPAEEEQKEAADHARGNLMTRLGSWIPRPSLFQTVRVPKTLPENNSMQGVLSNDQVDLEAGLDKTISELANDVEQKIDISTVQSNIVQPLRHMESLRDSDTLEIVQVQEEDEICTMNTPAGLDVVRSASTGSSPAFLIHRNAAEPASTNISTFKQVEPLEEKIDHTEMGLVDAESKAENVQAWGWKVKNLDIAETSANSSHGTLKSESFSSIDSKHAVNKSKSVPGCTGESLSPNHRPDTGTNYLRSKASSPKTHEDRDVILKVQHLQDPIHSETIVRQNTMLVDLESQIET